MNVCASSSDNVGAPNEAEVAASVGLALLPGVGPRTIKQWLTTASSADAVWRDLPAWVRGRRDGDDIVAAWRSLDPVAVAAAAHAHEIDIVAWRDPRYPERLREIVDAPPVLFVRGALAERPAVAIVGARRATAYGRAAASRIGFDLAQVGVMIVSGLARGIDGAAHVAALEGEGVTIGVLGCGVDVIYPREHRALAAAIAQSGALVSEFAPATPPLPHHFPRRNRLISGLADGVIVVEGSDDSGALITVDYALDQGREVFAVPGSIFSAKSRAPHRLLRQGARIVESAQDVLDELRLERHAAPVEGSTASGTPATVPASGARSFEASVLAALDSGPLGLDDVVDVCGLPASRVAATVTELELRGLIRMLPGQMVVRTPRGGAG